MNKIDSLQNELRSPIRDEEKADIYIQLSQLYREQYDSANTVFYADRAMELSKEANYCEGKSDAFKHTISLYGELGHYKSARQLLDSSFVFAKDCDYAVGIANAFLGYGGLLDYESKYEEAIDYYEKAVEIALSENDMLLLASIYNNMAVTYLKLGDFTKSTDYLISAKDLHMEFGTEYHTFISYLNLSQVYQYIGEYPNVLKNILLALEVAESMENRSAIASCLSGVSDAYYLVDEYEKALPYALRALSMQKDLNNDKRGMAVSLNSLGIIYRHLSKYDSSMLCFEESLDISIELKDSISISNNQLDISSILLRKGEIDAAKTNYEHALQIALAIEDIGTIASANSSLGSIYLKQHSYEQARLHLKKGLTYARQSGGLETMKDILENLSLTEDRLGNDSHALAYHREFFSYYDSLMGEEKSKEFARLEIQYETEKKEQEIENLSQQATIQSLQLSEQKNQLWIGGLAALVIIATGFTYFSWDKSKKKKKAVELEQRFLRSQLNPHFIFNSMTAIQQYVLKKEPKQANNYINLFSTLMRQILENSREEFISLKEEVSMLKNYLELQLVRHENKFEYEIIIDEALDESYTGIPPMFAQPFIENSLEHGLFKKDGNNNINIKFNYIDEHSIGLEIIDSGVGITQTSTRVNHNSLASKITQERLATLTSQKIKAGLKSKNIISSNGEILGLSIHLHLPSKLMFGT